MKHIIIFALFCSYSVTAISQNTIPSGRQFSNLMQIDSSDNYVAGSGIDKTNKSQFVGRQFGFAGNFWTNLYFFNSSANRSIKLFDQSPIALMPIQSGEISFNRFESLQKGTYFSAITKQYIILLVKTDEFLTNGLIDDDDPTSLFICTTSGQNLTRVSPLDFNVTAWRLSKDEKILFITGQHDKNNDKSFASEDETVYEVKLSLGLTNIKLVPLKF